MLVSFHQSIHIILILDYVSHHIHCPFQLWNGSKLKSLPFVSLPRFLIRGLTFLCLRLLLCQSFEKFFLSNLCDLLPFLFFGSYCQAFNPAELASKECTFDAVSNSLLDILLLSRFRTYKTYIHLSCSFIILIGN